MYEYISLKPDILIYLQYTLYNTVFMFVENTNFTILKCANNMRIYTISILKYITQTITHDIYDPIHLYIYGMQVSLQDIVAISPICSQLTKHCPYIHTVQYIRQGETKQICQGGTKWDEKDLFSNINRVPDVEETMIYIFFLIN